MAQLMQSRARKLNRILLTIGTYLNKMGLLVLIV